MTINDLKPIEDALVNVNDLEGNKAKIGSVEEMEVPSNFSARGKQWVIKISTDGVQTESGQVINASELFNLKEDNAQPTGWSTQGKLQKFLEKMKVKHPSDLVGKTVTLRARDNFLGFII